MHFLPRVFMKDIPILVLKLIYRVEVACVSVFRVLVMIYIAIVSIWPYQGSVRY